MLEDAKFPVGQCVAIESLSYFPTSQVKDAIPLMTALLDRPHTTPIVNRLESASISGLARFGPAAQAALPKLWAVARRRRDEWEKQKGKSNNVNSLISPAVRAQYNYELITAAIRKVRGK